MSIFLRPVCWFKGHDYMAISIFKGVIGWCPAYSCKRCLKTIGEFDKRYPILQEQVKE